jgi:stage V sporulation protein SpoVS
MIDGVMVDTRAARDHIRQVAPDVSQKLCRIAGLMMSRIRRKDPVEIALIGSRPVDGVIRAFAAVVLAQRFFKADGGSMNRLGSRGGFLRPSGP